MERFILIQTLKLAHDIECLLPRPRGFDRELLGWCTIHDSDDISGMLLEVAVLQNASGIVLVDRHRGIREVDGLERLHEPFILHHILKLRGRFIGYCLLERINGGVWHIRRL